MRCADPDDILVMSADENPSQLNVRFESISKDKTSNFSLNLVSLDGDQVSIPSQNYTNLVVLSSGEFTRICKELNFISENVKIETKPGRILFSVSGDIGQGSVEMRENQGPEEVIINSSETVVNFFSLSFLNVFNKASSLTDKINIYFSSNTPLVLEYKISNFGMVKFFLAPRMQDE